MKTLNEIYDSIKSRFFKKTKLDIESGTVIDSYILATSEVAAEAHAQIESNKNPHIFTKLSGDDLDSTGYLVGCPRNPNESDNSYKYRLMQWNISNKAANSTAIDTALMNLKYSSNAKYVPYTQGVGTATIYIIPTSYDLAEQAVAEVQNRVSKIINPSGYVEWVIPDPDKVTLSVYLRCEEGDEAYIKEQITEQVKDYINNLAPGEYMEIGAINKIGLNQSYVQYFDVANLLINDETINKTRVLQKVESKLLFDKIIWWMAVE